MKRKTVQSTQNENNLSHDETAEILENLAQESEYFRESQLPGTVFQGEQEDRLIAYQDRIEYQVMDQETGEYQTVTEEHFNSEEDLKTIFNNLEEREQNQYVETSDNYEAANY